MYSHLTQAVALEQIADRLELAAAERRSAELLRPDIDAERSGRSRRSARSRRSGLAAQPTGRPAHVRWSGEVATRRESGCAGA